MTTYDLRQGVYDKACMWLVHKGLLFSDRKSLYEKSWVFKASTLKDRHLDEAM